MKNICVWSSPRNISTALMYSFSRRNDIQVVDEPLYGYYLNGYSGKEHPGQKEIIDSMETDGTKLVNFVVAKHKPRLWHKMMTKHITGLDWSFLTRVQNVLLIRDPRSIIYSYSKVMSELKIEDIGIPLQREVYDYLDSKDEKIVVIDTSDVLKNPKHILSELCNQLNLEWNENMLNWSPGPIEEDGIWAKYWYDNVHKSTGFSAYEEKEIKLDSQQEKIAQACQAHYNYLYKHAIK